MRKYYFKHFSFFYIFVQSIRILAYLYSNFCNQLIIIPMGKSAIMTGVAIANSMFGSSMIIFPLNFNQYGILINIIFLLFMSAVMCLTCVLLVRNLRQDQLDISQSIKRRLGPNYANAFGVMSSVTLFLVSSVFFLLAVDIFFDVFVELFGKISFSEKLFKIICLVFFAALNYLKDLKYVFKMSPVAMGALIISTLTLVGSIPQNIDNIDNSFFELKQLSFKDLLVIASINGFAFISHPSISPMIKENQNQSTNKKAVIIGYSITIVLYMIVGVLGALSIYGKHPAKKNNVMDYFSGSWQAPIIGSMSFFYLFMISPIFPYVSKNQAIELIPKNKRQKITNLWMKATVGYSVLWVPMNILFILFDTSPVIVISFISAVMCFFITYFLPIYMTVRIGDYLSANVNEIQEQLTSSTPSEGSIVKEPDSILTEGSLIQNDNKIPLIMKVIYVGILIYGLIILFSELIFMFI